MKLPDKSFAMYQKKASGKFKPGKNLCARDARLCDWAMGVAGEAGELLGLIQHHVYHQQPLDRMKVAKEVGDVLWYLSALCESLGLSLQGCAELNLAKLEHRHGKKFSFDGSAERHKREEKFEETKEYKNIKVAYFDSMLW